MANGDMPASPWHSSAFEYDVAVIGLGDLGLSTALTYYASGRRVVAIDISTDRLILIGAGLIDATDRDRARLNEALLDDRFQMTADLRTLAAARSVVVCVPTPVDEFFTLDPTGLMAACAAIAEYAQLGQLVMLTSTTYVGCTDDLLVRPLAARGMELGVDVSVAFATELTEPGSTAVEPEAVPYVVGGATAACVERAVATLSAYASDVREVPSLAIAEMTKLLENTFRAENTTLADLRARRLNVRSMITISPGWHGLSAS